MGGVRSCGMKSCSAKREGKNSLASLPSESCSSGLQEVRDVQIVGDTERHLASAGVPACTALSIKLIYSVLTK